MAHIDELSLAVAQLRPQPRKDQWRSLSSCVLDAVWSIGAHYDHVVAPLVRQLAGDEPLKKPHETVPDPCPTSAFLRRYPTEEDLLAKTNRQRTSPRGGITKAAAALEHLRVFQSFEIETLADAQKILADANRLQPLEVALRRIKGEGAYGIRRKYLWMLVGAEDLIKPDRMVCAWLRDHGCDSITPAEAAAIIKQISANLDGRYSPWEIDHAIWLAQRSRGQTRQKRR